MTGSEREIAILFADIRSFTELAETKLPYDVVFLLNRYFEEMGRAIEGAGGRVDKFIGDGIMALWGAPTTHADDPIRSVQSALDQMEILGKFNRRRMDADLLPLAIGIALIAGAIWLTSRANKH